MITSIVSTGDDASLERFSFEVKLSTLIVHGLERTLTNHDFLSRLDRLSLHLDTIKCRKESNMSFFGNHASLFVGGVRRMNWIMARTVGIISGNTFETGYTRSTIRCSFHYEDNQRK
jgi:hypothetical protein